MATEKKIAESIRTTFQEEDMRFMLDYKQEFGSTLQWFIETAVKEKITAIRIKQQLGEEI